MTVIEAIQYVGPEFYEIPLAGSFFSLVLEDDGEVGYLYVTNQHGTEILDALQLYVHGRPGHLVPGDEVLVAWNSAMEKVAVHYHREVQAVVDFANRRASCRAGFPPPSKWCMGSHEWDETLLAGLELKGVPS